MKKLFACFLAVAMTASLSLPAFAAKLDEGSTNTGISAGANSNAENTTTTLSTVLSNSPATGNGAGDYSIGVNGAYQAASPVAEKISVDIAWEAMSFTYTAGNSTYSPENHTTTTTNGSWSTNKPGITVTNHSNVAIDASFSFAQASALPAGTTITGKFYDKSGDGETATYAENTAKRLTLVSGEDKTTEGETYTTPTATIYFGIDAASSAITADVSLGTVTVKIVKDASSESGTTETWTTVTDEAGLKAALQAGGKVKLGANIELTEGIKIELTSGIDELNILLDLNGYSITNATESSISNMLEFNNDAEDKTLTLVVKDSSANETGKIENKTEDKATLVVYGLGNQSANITLESGTVSGFVALTLTGSAKASIKGGKLSSSGSEDALRLSGPTSSAVITGGTFTFDPTNYVDANAYTVTKNTDGTWTVTAKTAD